MTKPKKPSKPDRLALWAHLVSAHAIILGTDVSMRQLRELHKCEHNGPCGIRNHDENDLAHSLARIGHVLMESDDETPDPK